MQQGFDPIFQVLQASFNQTGRGNHHAVSSFGLDSIVHLCICDGENVECPISAETLQCGDWASRMPCGHYFSKESLMAWLEQHNSCPVCRYELHTGKLCGLAAQFPLCFIPAILLLFHFVISHCVE